MPDFRSLSRTCGGTGWLDCECGGDFCVCKLNGGTDCLGCEDCREQDEEDDYPDPLYEPECDQCGGTTREGFCRTCQA